MKTELVVLVDESGSMGHLVQETIGGINSFIKEQQEQPGDAVLSIYKFDHRFRYIYQGVDVLAAQRVTTSDYTPTGMTAMYDAIGKTMNKVGERIQSSKPDKVIMCIITDGKENASQEFGAAEIKLMIAHAKKNGWEFVFLGADPTSVDMAVNIGIPQNMTSVVDATSIGTMASYGTMSAASAALRSGASAQSMNMTSQYREKLKDAKTLAKS